jgi:hypothetical protein
MEGLRETELGGSCTSPRSPLAKLRACLFRLIRLAKDGWLDSLFALVCFVALFAIPVNASDPDLDNSWHRALQECFKSRAQAGIDYVFTYGPLGCFLNQIYAEEIYWHKYVWELAVSLAMAVIVTFLGRQITHKGDRLLFYAIVLVYVYVTPVYDLRFVVSSLALAILLLVSVPHTSALMLAGLFWAVLCLGKFTQTVFIVPAILLVTAWKWWETGQRIVLALPLAFAASVVGLWLATGQALANLPRFVAMSLEIAGGYVDAMSLPGPRSSLFLALAIFGLDVLLFIAAALCSRRRARSLIGLALTFAALHLEFRHGFIRQDSHCLMFFGFAMTVPFFVIVIEPDVATRRWARLGIGLTLLLAAQAYQQADGLQAPDVPRRILALYRNLRTNIALMRHPIAHQDALRHLENCRREAYELPKIKARVGSASIDMVSCRQAILFLNGLHWMPRPVFQSYSAYTPKLLMLNQEFYSSRAAPRFVLFHLNATDDRFPATEDSGVLFKLFQHYRPVMKEKEYLLLEHRQETDCRNPPAPLATYELTTHFGELMHLPSTTGTYLTASIHFPLRMSGKLLRILYRNPLLYLNMHLNDGSVKQYRLIPGMTANEFLLSPLLEDHDDFVGLYCEKNTKRIIALSVTKEDFYGLQPYEPEIRLILKSYPSTFISHISADEWGPICYGALGAIPLRVEGIHQDVSVEKQECMHVEGTVIYAVHPGQRRISGRYGIEPGAYHPGKTDGVDFVIEYVPTSGARMVLFRKRLTPTESPGDRGSHAFSTELPRNHSGGTLQLHTKDPPPHSTNWDWSYWSQIHFE